MKSWKTPTAEQVKKAIALMAQPEQQRYFFDRLENPCWLEPLASRGFFGNPPQIIRDEKKEAVQFPPWPESRYLARMAAAEPQRVLEIFLELETENPSVHENLVEAALAMPPELAAKLTPKVLTCVENRYTTFRPDKIGQLISNLAKGDQVDSALSILQVLLAVFSDNTSAVKPRARFSAYYYKRILQKNIPDLIAMADVRALTLLCDHLQDAVELSCKGRFAEKPRDYSEIWRPMIDSTKQYRQREIRDLLVSGVRDAAIQIVSGDKMSITSVVDTLEQRQWDIFRRIALHLLRISAEEGHELVVARLENMQYFAECGMEREYALLLRDRFGSLPEEAQQVILRVIEEGPDLNKFREGRSFLAARSPNDDECREYAEKWRLKHLHWIHDSLSAEWEQRYDALIQEFGEPQDPESPMISEAVWVGPETPKSEEELLTMSSEQVVAYLRSWRPSEKSFGAPTIEGLGRRLKVVVSARPDEFSQHSVNFRDLQPTYVRALLAGLRDAVGKKQFVWESVVDLCAWVVDQQRAFEGGAITEIEPEFDLDWGPTRATIGRLISAGVQEGELEVPFVLRDKIWHILLTLTKDPDPTPEYEMEFGGTNMDPVTMSINTVRGEVMHAVVRYALWVRRQVQTAPDAEQRLARGFDELSEVRTVLDDHLDHTHDPSLAIRAVYGQWLPWLILLDRGWATEALSRIFPNEAGLKELRDAAWDAYIISCQPYDDIFDLLEAEYVRAIERMETTSDERRHLRDPNEALAEHLMVFYWRGKLAVNDTEGFLQRFYLMAPDSLRAHALDYMGRSLGNTKDAVEVDILERLKSLWQTRLEAARLAADPRSHVSELAAFGSWFISGKFDNTWAIAELVEALSLVKEAEPEDAVIERLATLSQEMPAETVRCLSLMIEGATERWKIDIWENEIRAIVNSAKGSANADARNSAVALVNKLGSMGFFGFHDLLSSQ